jgi:hypothetical protein
MVITYKKSQHHNLSLDDIVAKILLRVKIFHLACSRHKLNTIHEIVTQLNRCGKFWRNVRDLFSQLLVSD